MKIKRTLLAWVVMFFSVALAHAGTSSRPNIVVIIADDWGFSDVGAFGSEIATPNIDQLARKGVKFSNFHVAATCSPTRAMLLTGVDNHRNGLGSMAETQPAQQDGKPGYETRLNDRVVTVSTMLKDAGYHTYITGKWHLGKTTDTLPNRRGYERSFIQANSGSDNWEQRPYIFLYDKDDWYEQGMEAKLPEDFYSSKFIVDKAIEYVDSNRGDGKPFFAHLAFQANHIPVQAPKEFVRKYRDKYNAGWTALRKARFENAKAMGLIPKEAELGTMATTKNWDTMSPQEQRAAAREMEVYGGMAETMDFHIGRFIEHLKKTGAYENTVFVFLSDNGPEPTDPMAITATRLWLKAKYDTNTDKRMGTKGTYGIIGPSWASAAASPFTGYKVFAGEGGLRTPLIIAGPGMRNNQLMRGFTHVTDIAPTLLELAGVPTHKGQYAGQSVEPMIGSSMLAVLQGHAEQVHPADQAIGYELNGSAALFKGNYKLLRNFPPMGDGAWHLYDLSNDPGEVHDLQTTMPDLTEAMQQDYLNYASNNGVQPLLADYDYVKQTQIYALHHAVLPQIKQALATYGLGFFALVGSVLWWRQRPKAA